MEVGFGGENLGDCGNSEELSSFNKSHLLFHSPDFDSHFGSGDHFHGFCDLPDGLNSLHSETKRLYLGTHESF